MMTAIDWPLYIEPSFWVSPASGYHGCNEAASAPPILFRRVARRRGTFWRTYGVRAVDVQRSRPVPGEPADQWPRVPGGDRPQTGGDFPSARTRETGSGREGRKSGEKG